MLQVVEHDLRESAAGEVRINALAASVSRPGIGDLGVMAARLVERSYYTDQGQRVR